MREVPRRHEVVLTRGAENDLESIYDYIAQADGPINASHVLDGLLEACESLAHFPERGSYPKELLELGNKEFRQTAFKPYRVIYRVADAQVIIYLIVDGRRDMMSVLTRRLLAA
jgi:toxin ParE1/3/4